MYLKVFPLLLDILLFSKKNKKHLEHLRTASDRLYAADLKPKRTKCDLFKCELHYFTHLISDKGIYPLPEKL